MTTFETLFVYYCMVGVLISVWDTYISRHIKEPLWYTAIIVVNYTLFWPYVLQMAYASYQRRKRWLVQAKAEYEANKDVIDKQIEQLYANFKAKETKKDDLNKDISATP